MFDHKMKLHSDSKNEVFCWENFFYVIFLSLLIIDFHFLIYGIIVEEVLAAKNG